MHQNPWSAAALALSFPILAANRAAADVWIVDAAGAGEFAEIRDAVVAAHEGDTLFVRPGVYAPFTILGKELHLVATARESVVVTGRVEVALLAPWQEVTLAGLSIALDAGTALLLREDQGAVRVTNSRFEGGEVVVSVVGCEDVAFSTCSMIGVDPDPGDYGQDGALALFVQDAQVALYECYLRGSDGAEGHWGNDCFDHCTDGGYGGSAAVVYQGAFLFASDSYFERGLGGEAGPCFCYCTCEPGQPGLALWTWVGGQAVWLDCVAVGDTAGDLELLPGGPKSLELPSLVTESSTITARFRGAPGDELHLFGSPRAAFDYRERERGVALLADRFPNPVEAIGGPIELGSLHLNLGVLPPSGILRLPAKVLPMSASEPARVHHLQALFIETNGEETWSSNAVVVALDESAYVVDCPPGACDPPSLLYVDDDAPGDPGPGDTSSSDPLEDGSAAHPFDAVQEALSSVADDGEVVVRDGFYTGPGNRRIDFGGRDLRLRSSGGSAHCTLDAEGEGSVVCFVGGESPLALIEGFTLRGASTSGIEVRSSSPTIRSCEIVGNSNPDFYGGGIHVNSGSPRITACVIHGNSAGSAGGIYVYAPVSTPEIRDTSLFDNHSTSGAAIEFYGPELRIWNSTVGFNSADSNPGGIRISGPNHVLRCSNCILWGDDGPEILAYTGTSIALDHCDLEGGMNGIMGTAQIQWGPGNLDVDPSFVDGPGGDVHLRGSSACIGAGDPSYAPLPGETDVDGDPRVLEGHIEIGSDETLADCNEDGVPDAAQIFHADSPILSPIGADSPQSYLVLAPPPATSGVVFDFGARADLGAADEFLVVRVNGVELGSVFVTGASDCPDAEDAARLFVSALDFDAAVAGGDALVELLASPRVDSTCVPPASYVHFTLAYGDCDANGVLDACELADGTLPDQNGNGVPDPCE